MNKKHRRRPYARRLPTQFARRVMLCVRVSKEVKVLCFIDMISTFSNIIINGLLCFRVYDWERQRRMRQHRERQKLCA